MSYRGIQYTPVDCKATVFTPQFCNQSANRHRSPRRVHGPPPNPDSPIATAARVPSSLFDFATASCPFSSLSSSVEMRIRFGPVTNGLRNSPTGSKGRYNAVLATRLVIASTGAMLIVGHEAPCRISALACRIESRKHTGKEGTLDKFLALATRRRRSWGLSGGLAGADELRSFLQMLLLNLRCT